MINKIFGEVKGIFNTLTMIDVVIAIIYIIIGLLFFTNAASSNIVVSVITGLILISSGISAIFAYLRKDNIELFNFNLIIGIIMVAVGIVAMFLGKVLSIALGIYFIVSAASKFSYSYFLKKFNESCWLFNLFVGVLYLVLGITTFFTSGEAAIKVAGICLLGYGVMNLISVILLRKRSKFFIA